MNLTPTTGTQAATHRARENRERYFTAQRLYGRNIGDMLGGAPIGLLLGHVLRVNPALVDAPPVKRDRRVGFMKASVLEARTVKIPTKQLEEPSTCAFVYGREINRAASTLYTTYKSLFTIADTNLWKCAYLYTTIGATTFDFLWEQAGIGIQSTSKPVLESGNWVIQEEIIQDSTNNAYVELLAALGALTKPPPGWNLNELKSIVFIDCEYVYALWKTYGGGQMTFGYLPVLQNSQMTTIMNRVK